MKSFLYRTKWNKFHPTAFSAWERIHANDRRDPEQLAEEHLLALKEIVRVAFIHTRFYSHHYAASGFELGDMEQDGWFEKLPVVTKKDLREHFEEFIDASQRRYLKVSTTGGSTGTPTKTGYDGRIPEEIYSWRLQSWFGVNPWDDHAYVWRDTRSSWLAKFKNAAMWWPTRHLKMDATLISEDGMKQFLRKYNKLRPTLLQGYVGAVSQLSRYVVDNGIKVHPPKFVWTTSAPLPDSQRRLIQAAFHAPVSDQYGSCELRWIAAQCPECAGLHVNTEHVHIEFVDDSNSPVTNGLYGRTLLTNLEDTVFPLIRYENGDRGRWSNAVCSCGRSLPIIDSVKGRESENFKLPSGKIVNGEFLTTIFDAAPGLVRDFRVVQHRDLSITIEYVANTEKDCQPEINKIANALSKTIENEVPIDSRWLVSIPHDRGKLRFVVCD